MGAGGLSPIEGRRELESAGAPRRIDRQPQAGIEADAPSGGISLEPVVRRWRAIAALTLLAVAATFTITASVMPRWYQATAMIRPSSDSAIGKQLSLGGELPLQGLGEAMLGGGLSEKAEEYVAILSSFAFNLDLVKRHHLEGAFRTSHWWSLYPRDPEWEIYRTLQRRFNADYSYRTNMITLSLTSRSRAEAARVLGYYVDDLRAQLRERELHSTGLAINAIADQVSKTGDALLQNRLYELMAEQIKRNRLAQVQADYSFTVIAPPAAPDRPYRPLVEVDCLLIGLITPFGLALLILLDERKRERRAGRNEDGRSVRTRFD